MTDKFESINSEEIKLNNKGELELSEELMHAIAGGFTPEEGEEEGTNHSCPSTINGNCGE